MHKTLYALFGILLLLVGGACSTEKDTDPIQVMTMNMRYDNPQDNDNNWKYRYGRIADMLRRERPDLLGTQELLAHQLDTLKSRLGDYATVGVAREDGMRQGEYSAIFYRKDRFEEIGSGNFWLSETPDSAGSFGWDAACVRVATWAVLKDRETQRELLFLNTHFDHVGQVARLESGNLMLERLGLLAQGRPVIVTGDFNADPQSDVIRNILSKGLLHHAKDCAKEVKGAAWSFTDFGRIPLEKRQLIDYIFINDGFTASRYEVMAETDSENRHYSDHAPVRTFLHYTQK